MDQKALKSNYPKLARCELKYSEFFYTQKHVPKYTNLQIICHLYKKVCLLLSLNAPIFLQGQDRKDQMVGYYMVYVWC